MMILDNGAADGQANPHSAALGCIESLEELVHALRFEADTSILHDQTNTITFISFCSDQQPPRPIVDAAHRVGCIPEQVQDDLLQLHAIASDKRQIVG